MRIRRLTVRLRARRINRIAESRLREKYMTGLEPTEDNEQQADLCAHFEMRRRRVMAQDIKFILYVKRNGIEGEFLKVVTKELESTRIQRILGWGDGQMKEKIVYLLTGETGEYSDRQEWPVAVFTKEIKAMLYKKLCEKEIEGINPRDWHLSTVKSRFDPNIQMDYTGTSYFISEVPLNPKADSNA